MKTNISVKEHKFQVIEGGKKPKKNSKLYKISNWISLKFKSIKFLFKSHSDEKKKGIALIIIGLLLFIGILISGPILWAKFGATIFGVSLSVGLGVFGCSAILIFITGLIRYITEY